MIKIIRLDHRSDQIIMTALFSPLEKVKIVIHRFYHEELFIFGIEGYFLSFNPSSYLHTDSAYVTIRTNMTQDFQFYAKEQP